MLLLVLIWIVSFVESFPSFIARHGRTLGDTLSTNSTYFGSYRYLSLSIHGDPNDPRYSFVMTASSVSQHVYFYLTFAGFQATFDLEASLNYAPKIIVATGPSNNARFAAVFEYSSTGIPYTRHGLTKDTLPNTWELARNNTLIPSWFATYGESDDPRYITILASNPTKTIWNADGLEESAAVYQARFNAQTASWCRPSIVGLNYDAAYISLFVDNSIGPWIAKHDMTHAGYQSVYDDLYAQGYYPIQVQGGGVGSATRYAALFAPNLPSVIPKQFTANCPTPYAPIDNIIKQAMKDSPVRHASLAIVRGDRLVYTCGYTFAEPGWPEAEPTTKFRIASVSKTLIAVGIFQALEKGLITLSTTMQSILNLTSPIDPKFSWITIEHLLEHNSGLNPGGWDNDATVLAYWKGINSAHHYPVTESMTDGYIAAQSLLSIPGMTQVYNNCGYYLLGRILAKLYGTDVMSALQSNLLTPLQLNRITAASSVIPVETSPLNEARYRAQDIPIFPSVTSSSQTPVANGYGNFGLLHTKIGAGGISAAATDLARIVSLLIYRNDTYKSCLSGILGRGVIGRTSVIKCTSGEPFNILLSPIIKRSTIETYLNLAVLVAQIPGFGRAGYGFDAAGNVGTDYYLQKGGSLATSGNVLQVNGQWGFVMNWAGKATAATNWYPNYPDVMNQAMAYFTATSPDLFDDYGILHHA